MILNLSQASARLLVVEDDPGFSRAVCRMLSSQGYDITAVSNAEEAASALEEPRFDAVLLDLGLPGAPGLLLLRELHRADEDLPVIVMSGQGTMDDVIEALRHRAVDYLRKPFQPPEVFAAVERAVAMRRSKVPNSESSTLRATTLDEQVPDMLAELRRGVVQLPVIDPRVKQIRALMSRPTSGLKDVLDIIGHDPVLVAGVLKRANGGFFGRRKVTSLHQACVLLGNNQVFALAIEAMVLNTFHVASRELDAVWRKMRRNLVLTAGIALRLAELAGVDDPEEYYVLGLLHNLGEVAMLQLLADRVERGDLALDMDMMAAAIEVHHESFGNTLAEQWGLPQNLCEIMAHHHRPAAPHEAEAQERRRHIVLGAWKQALAEQFIYLPGQNATAADASVHFTALGVAPRKVIAASAILAKSVQ